MNRSSPALPHSVGARTGRPVATRMAVRARIVCVLAVLPALILPSLAACSGQDGPGGAGPPSSPAATQLPTAPPARQDPAPEVPRTAPPAPAPAGPAAAPPERLVYPAAGIDVPVYPLDPSAADQEQQTIIPPSTKDGYWLTPYGIPGAGSTNTTYIVGHSWQDQDAPFNHLSTLAGAGDLMTVRTAAGDLSYRVESVTTYVKSGLKDSPIWAVSPNTVVLISCYTDDLWGTNVVVVAVPA